MPETKTSHESIAENINRKKFNNNSSIRSITRGQYITYTITATHTKFAVEN